MLFCLAYGGVPECPNHAGVRTDRSEVASGFGSLVSIVGIAQRTARGCGFSAHIEVEQKGKKVFNLPEPGKRGFSIVDFSPDGRSLLLSSQIDLGYPYEDYRNVEVTTMDLSTGEMHWANAWDILGWHDCVSTIEAQGFASDGKVVLRPRMSIRGTKGHPDCVKTPELFETDLKPVSAQKLPNDARVERYGKRIHPAYEACKADPDITGACFNVYGRLSIWNGAPSLRIWRIGTKRILGVQNETLPEGVANRMDFGVEATGDFEVCPFTEERAGEMQMVCVESAENVTYKKY
jgi:hypothetical protein